MVESFLGVLSPLLMLFLCILLGFLLNKLKVMPEATSTVLSKLEKYVFMPALSYSTFSKYCTIQSLGENASVIMYSAIALAVEVAIAIPLSKLFERNDIDKRNIYRYSLVFANSGFMGNAIVPLVLGGQEHLYKYLLFSIPISCLIYTWGNNLLTPEKFRSKNLLLSFVNAPFLGIVAGMIVGLSGVQKYIPEFVNTTVDSLKSCMAPVAMILTGFVVGNYPLKSLLLHKKVYIATALRLIVIPSVILIILMLCGAGKYTVTLALFAFATPLGLNTVVFPAVYGGDTHTGASMAMISHTLCVITIPLMYGIFQLL